nr:trehalose-phosphatase [Pararhodobacter sp. SW119]
MDALRLTARDALYLDFDGTLAEIGPDPDAIMLSATTLAALTALAARLGGALAVLSGRDLRDLARRTPDSLWRVGGHGLEVLPPGATIPPAASAPSGSFMDALLPLAVIPGVRIEVKGPVVAIHYRAAPEAEVACLEAAKAALDLAPGYSVQSGKMIVELKPQGADKGAALRRLASLEPFAGRRPIMLGDDTTDEDAMRAARALGGIAVKVGEGESVADLRANDPAAVRAWIAREAERA